MRWIASLTTNQQANVDYSARRPGGRLSRSVRGLGNARPQSGSGSIAGEALGTFVLERREELGMSQADASKRAGVSKTTWQQIEWGKGRGARTSTLRAVATALDVEPSLLISLRDGGLSVADARILLRPRHEVIASIVRACEWLLDTDLYDVEQDVLIRAELRRRQQQENTTVVSEGEHP